MGGRTSPFSMLIGGAAGVVMGTLFKYRALPFLKGNTIISGGKQMPTAEFAAFGARWFYVFGAACVIGSLIWLAVRARLGITMKPSVIRYFFGHGFAVSMCVGALVVTVLVGWSCGAFSIWATIAVLIALPLGGVLGALFLWPFVFAIGSKINGSPFHADDLVHILVGPHRDRVGRICEMWPSRNQVRVQISEQAEKDVADVFSYNEICRERDVNKLG
jgi:hypothetical protein